MDTKKLYALARLDRRWRNRSDALSTRGKHASAKPCQAQATFLFVMFGALALIAVVLMPEAWPVAVITLVAGVLLARSALRDADRYEHEFRRYRERRRRILRR